MRRSPLRTLVHGALALCPRAVKVPIYRRVFGSEEMSDVRIYPGLAFPVALFGAYVNTKLPATLRRYPFFMSTEDEREKLFARALDDNFEAPQRASSRLAYERALLEQQFGTVAAE